MSLLEAVLLGVVQGLTEFLPVSSSGHLVLTQSLLGVEMPGVVFETVVHVATLAAVLWVYRARVGELARGLAARDRSAIRYVLMLALASVPAGVVGVAGRGFFESMFDTPVAAATFLLVTGGLVWTIRHTADAAADREPDAGQSLWAGCAQALAILPGISRSGSTVAAGVWRGVEPVRMAEFSFLLSVPAIGGAALLQLDGVAEASAQGGTAALAAGFVTAAVSGVLAIRLFVRALEARAFHRFAYYCWAVGGTYLAAAWLVPGWGP
ncbi:MAG: undecaprenyl-diphosphate phosphatase [Gemmatimonadota bacterium]